ncbi:nuclear transport factor 2 family protein [Actinocorallia sp. A-T 12471]|uniref:nuclear transport factor 2 family protein n=1 Tax=Actinocorallia sp. A-T 12471 TaxID=3089813 RepID=UPI0029CC1B18|nr:nuclear transport factor 2 family protein [Actinocorallia sp. A-T 12471]MDX6741195.1 nuclear transport factor 2 family protein [Actinocorallia sp. A-T 12471]
MSDAALATALVTQVVLAERQGRDRGWWDQMAAQYWPDSHVRLSWYDGDGPGFVAGSKAMAARGDVALHHVFAPVVHVRGDRAHVEAAVSLRFAVEIDGVAGDLVSHTRLNYRLTRRDGVWKILALNAVYEYATLTPAVPGQTIVVPAEELAKYRPSYAVLAWNIAREGRKPGDDELGDDRPEELAAFYAETRAWLNGSG